MICCSHVCKSILPSIKANRPPGGNVVVVVSCIIEKNFQNIQLKEQALSSPFPFLSRVCVCVCVRVCVWQGQMSQKGIQKRDVIKASDNLNLVKHGKGDQWPEYLNQSGNNMTVYRRGEERGAKFGVNTLTKKKKKNND